MPGTWKLRWYWEYDREIYGFGWYYEVVKDTVLKGFHIQLGSIQFGVMKEFMLDLDREV